MMIQVCLLMAGQGTRFKDLNESSPKPYCILKNRPLFEWALEGLKPIGPWLVVHTCIRKEHHFFWERAKKNNPNLNIKEHFINGCTAGPAETASLIENSLMPNRPLIILDCDILFSGQEMISKVLSPEPDKDGYIFTFQSNKECYSYVQKSDLSIALQVAEKKVISNDAIAGIYYFKKAKMFFEAYRNTQFGLSEKYISSVIQNMIQCESVFGVVPLDRHVSLGTAEDILIAREQELE